MWFSSINAMFMLSKMILPYNISSNTGTRYRFRFRMSLNGFWFETITLSKGVAWMGGRDMSSPPP